MMVFNYGDLDGPPESEKVPANLSPDHVALVMGDVRGRQRVTTRVHSECLTSEVFGSLKCDCKEQLEAAQTEVARRGYGVADEDIAAVAVRALTSQQLDGQKIVLTGPHSLTMREQVRAISRAIGQPVDVIEIADAEARALYGRILPPKYLELLMAQWAFEQTEPAAVTEAVERITGRPATTYSDWATRHTDAFD